MYGRIVLDIEGHLFDEPFEKAKARAGVAADYEIPAVALAELAEEYKHRTGSPWARRISGERACRRTGCGMDSPLGPAS